MAIMHLAPRVFMADKRCIAVGGPVARVAVLAFFAHDDDRIEEAAELGDHAFELAHVSIGKIALIGRRLDLIDRQ